ncbi:DUF4276 family protein [Chromobacterium subtsugae]|uniref:DUF4276 family protein n=1 Tax=Chromobacterium subtsugae TaxID=251747 RepID=UPI0009B9722E|nr:DUF4276 family protein [Chromobacterium subtsugae]
MTRTYILVEGQTEEAFVNELLIPHYARIGLYLTPIIVSTSPGHKGGVVNYQKIKPQILRLCKQDRNSYVSTMFDLYALPSNFPGKSHPNYLTHNTGTQKAHFLEQHLKQDIQQVNFIPNLIVHEFEALLFTNPETFNQWVDDITIVNRLKSINRQYVSPEDINDGPLTAPSKRIIENMPEYQKTVHGPLIACDIGLDAIRQSCPHFHEWLNTLEALP